MGGVRIGAGAGVGLAVVVNYVSTFFNSELALGGPRGRTGGRGGGVGRGHEVAAGSAGRVIGEDTSKATSSPNKTLGK